MSPFCRWQRYLTLPLHFLLNRSTLIWIYIFIQKVTPPLFLFRYVKTVVYYLARRVLRQSKDRDYKNTNQVAYTYYKTLEFVELNFDCSSKLRLHLIDVWLANFDWFAILLYCLKGGCCWQESRHEPKEDTLTCRRLIFIETPTRVECKTVGNKAGIWNSWSVPPELLIIKIVGEATYLFATAQLPLSLPALSISCCCCCEETNNFYSLNFNHSSDLCCCCCSRLTSKWTTGPWTWLE